MYQHTETGTLFYSFDQLRLWLLTNYHHATAEYQLPDLMEQYGIIEYVPPRPNPPTEESIKTSLVNAVQQHLDTIAQTKGYDGILSVCSYDNDPNPVFAAEAANFKTWRSAVWTYCYQVLDDCVNNLRTIPTEAELIAELPTITL